MFWRGFLQLPPHFAGGRDGFQHFAIGLRVTSRSCLDAIRLKLAQLMVSSFNEAQRDMRVAFWWHSPAEP
jgi:hypothetical protein